MAVDHIFVYGSLRREFASPFRTVLENNAVYVGEATFRGKLYLIDWYPGVVESDDPDDKVHGEVYKLIDKDIVLTKLDRYEGCSPDDPKPHEFERKEKPVQFQNGEEIVVWIYIYVLQVLGKDQIYTGDFVI